jgi:HD-GYP domain-containing protein (c-di-GMP phosphodiesterase class II)
MSGIRAGCPHGGNGAIMHRVKVDAADVIAGMFVAQLDRPWLETPFLFQGFEVREDSEIDQLRHYCQHLYIDITRSSISAQEIEKLLTGSGQVPALTIDSPRQRVANRRSLLQRLLAWFGDFDPTGRIAHKLEGSKSYRIKRTLKKERPQATAAYGGALEAMNDVLEQVREGCSVDVEKVKESVGPMIESVLRNPGAITWFTLLKKRDKYTYNHSIASSVWATVLGRHLGFDRNALDTLALGGMLLDIGKAKLPEDLLGKQSELSNAECDLLRQHVDYGLELVNGYPGIGSEVLDMISSHHERMDGSGYPEGLSGSDIPVYGRIAGLVDCYDAMTSNRPYARAVSPYQAICDLNAMAGVHFQKELVEQFVQALGMFPTGSLIEFNSGEVGIVIGQNRVRRLRPKVMLVLNADKQQLQQHITVDLRKIPGDARKLGAKWILKGLDPGSYGIDPADFFA